VTALAFPSCRIRTGFGLSRAGSLIDDVRAVRMAALGLPAAQALDAIDAHSLLLVADVGDAPVATLRVTYARYGRIDCEPFFPAELLARHRHWLGSASRFGAVRGVPPAVARALIEAGWTLALRDGMRVDLIDVSARGRSYYRRLGYADLDVPGFRHPLFGTESSGMLFVTDPRRRTPLAPLFEGLASYTTELDFAPWLAPRVRGASVA
jgi:hypothetical protein